jgi:AcrR family transcriptional regulator
MARPRAQDYDEKRQAILDRAAELFAQHGYAGASIMMIADACGASKALLYHYYADKEAVLFDIIEGHLEHLIALVEDCFTMKRAPKEQLFAIAAALLDGYRNADAAHQVQINNLKLLPPDKQETLKELERALVRHFSKAIAAAVPDLDRAFLTPVTMSLFAMLNWHYLWFRDGRDLTRMDYARLVTELIHAGAANAVAALAQEKKMEKQKRPQLARKAR